MLGGRILQRAVGGVALGGGVVALPLAGMQQRSFANFIRRPRPDHRPDRPKKTPQPITTEEKIAVEVYENLVGARSVEEILKYYERAAENFNPLNLSTAFNLIMKKNLEIGTINEVAAQNLRKDPRLATLLATAVQALPSMNARSVATMAYSYTRLKGDIPGVEAMEPLRRRILEVLDDFTPLGLGMVAWSLSRMGASPANAELFERIATAAVTKVPQLKSREMAMLADAFSVAGVPAPALSSAFAREMSRRMRQDSMKRPIDASPLARVLYCLAKAGYRDAELFDTAEVYVTERLDKFAAADLAETLWAFAEVGHGSSPLFAAAEPVLQQLLEKANKGRQTPIVYTDIASALAKARRRAPQTFALVADRLAKPEAELTTAQQTALAWSFAATSNPAPALHIKLAEGVSKNIEALNPSQQARLLWAYSVVPGDHKRLLTSLAERLTPVLPTMPSEDVVAAVGALVRAGAAPKGFLDEVAKVVDNSFPSTYSLEQQAELWSAFATLNHPGRAVFDREAEDFSRKALYAFGARKDLISAGATSLH